MGVQLECRYIMPGDQQSQPAGMDPRSLSKMEILEQQLAVERLKGQYFSGIRHDLRTALDTISGGLTLA